MSEDIGQWISPIKCESVMLQSKIKVPRSGFYILSTMSLICCLIGVNYLVLKIQLILIANPSDKVLWEVGVT